MKVDFTRLNNAVIDSFAEDCVVKTNAGDYILEAVYFAPFEEYTLGGQIMNKPDHVVVMRTSEYAATSAADGDTINVRSNVMQIVGSEADEAGMTAVSLRDGVV